MPNLLLAPIPDNYAVVRAAVEADVKAARTRAVLAANTELIGLYFSIGRRLSEEASGWGERAVERLAEVLRNTFPEMKGFSRSNLFSMRRVWRAWKDAPDSVQQLVGRIPWGHHVLLVTRITDPSVRLFYVRGTLEHGWSRAILGLQVDTRLHEREGRAVTNFHRTLPPADLDLAEKTLKDPYIFDFLTTGDCAHEREVKTQLVGTSSGSCSSSAPVLRSWAGSTTSRSATPITSSTSCSSI